MRLQCRNFYTMCVCHGHCVEKKNFHWKSFHEISMIYWCWLEANFEEHSVEKQDITFNEDTYYVFFILFRQKRLAYTNYCHSFSQIFRQINVVLKNFTINWFDEKTLLGRKFLVFIFPQCVHVPSYHKFVISTLLLSNIQCFHDIYKRH